MIKRFRLAGMSADLLVMTGIALLLPIALGSAALVWSPTPKPALAVVFALVAVTYASVWLLWRPSSFDVGRDQLVIHWPLRQRAIYRSDIVRTEQLSAAELRARYGWGVRIGAGGLWGGFGLLKCSKETFSMWISRTDALVIVHLTNARPLLITPAQPDRFCAAIEALLAGRL